MKRKVEMCNTLLGVFFINAAIFAGVGIVLLLIRLLFKARVSWVCILVFFLLAIISIFCVRYSGYWGYVVCNIYDSDIFMKFRDWHKIYTINKSRWGIESLPCLHNDGNNRIVFSYFDWIKYRHMVSQINKREENERNNSNIIKIIEMAQSDIADLQAKANKEMNDGNKLILDVIGRMKQNG